MLTLVASGLVAAGALLLGTTLSGPLRGMLQLSDDLDGPRPMERADVRASDWPIAGLAVEVRPCTESMLRLSSAVSGSKPAPVTSEVSSKV